MGMLNDFLKKKTEVTDENLPTITAELTQQEVATREALAKIAERIAGLDERALGGEAAADKELRQATEERRTIEQRLESIARVRQRIQQSHAAWKRGSAQATVDRIESDIAALQGERHGLLNAARKAIADALRAVHCVAGGNPLHLRVGAGKWQPDIDAVAREEIESYAKTVPGDYQSNATRTEVLREELTAAKKALAEAA